MNRVKLLVLFFILFSGITSAQQMPLYSQYMMNGFLINPAMAGTKDYTPIALTVKQQWVGIDDAPQTYALSAHSAPFFNKNMGVGGYVFNDSFGPESKNGLQLAYSYHLELSPDLKLAFGLSAMAFQYSLNEADLELIDPDDNAITYGNETAFIPDANFGAYLYSTNRYYVGFSANQLIQMKFDLANVDANNQFVRHYFLHGGYKFNLDKIVKDFEVEPSLLLKATERSPIQVDINTKFIYKRNYWLGVSYRTNQEMVAMLGLKVDKYYIGYAFDYSFSPLSDYVDGSHEIMIGFNLGEGKSTGNSLM